MKVLECLKRDHEVFHLLLCSFEKQLKLAESNSPLNVDTTWEILDIIKFFALGSHMVKEERHLVPKLFSAGVPREYGPLLLMGQEHGRIHDAFAAINKSFDTMYEGDAKEKHNFIAVALPVIPFLRLHMMKEENSIFALAETILHEEDWDDLKAAFKHADRKYGQEKIDAVEKRIYKIGSVFGLTLQNGKVVPMSGSSNTRSGAFVVKTYQSL